MQEERRIRRSPEYLEKRVRSEHNAKRLQLILVLEDFDPGIANKMHCRGLVQSYKESVVIDGGLVTLDATLKHLDEWTLADYYSESYVMLASTWLSALDRIWTIRRIAVTSNILRIAASLEETNLLERTYVLIDKFPFLYSMHRDDSKASLAIVSSMDHIHTHKL